MNPQPSFTWSSNNTGIASVDNTGLVSGKSLGSASISASANVINGIATVNVALVYSMVGPWEFTTTSSTDGNVYSVEAELQNNITGATSAITLPAQLMNPSKLQGVLVDATMGLQTDSNGNFLHNDWWFGDVATMNGQNATNAITLAFANGRVLESPSTAR